MKRADVHIRIEEDVKARIEAAAAALQLSVSAFMTMASLKEVARMEKDGIVPSSSKTR